MIYKKQTHTCTGCFLSFLFFKCIGYTGSYTGFLWGYKHLTPGAGIQESQNITRIAVELITRAGKNNHIFDFK